MHGSLSQEKAVEEYIDAAKEIADLVIPLEALILKDLKEGYIKSRVEGTDLEISNATDVMCTLLIEKIQRCRELGALAFPERAKDTGRHMRRKKPSKDMA